MLARSLIQGRFIRMRALMPRIKAVTNKATASIYIATAPIYKAKGLLMAWS